MKIYNQNINNSAECRDIHNSGYLYEVHFDINKHVSFDLLNRTCTCRNWDLTGISCQHAMRAILSEREDHMLYVASIFKRHTYELSYRYKF